MVREVVCVDLCGGMECHNVEVVPVVAVTMVVVMVANCRGGGDDGSGELSFHHSGRRQKLFMGV